MSSDFGKQSIKNRRERYAVRGNDRASPLGFRSSPSASPAENVSPYSGKVQPLRNYARRARECPRGDGLFLSDFRSSPSVSAKRNTSQLAGVSFWRRHPDLNRGSRICSPMPYHLAMAPKKWSGQRDSNSLPPPWQGGALPNELCPHFVNASVILPQKADLSSFF